MRQAKKVFRFCECSNCGADFHRTLEFCPYCRAPFLEYRPIDGKISDKIFSELNSLAHEFIRSFRKPRPRAQHILLTIIRYVSPTLFFCLLSLLIFRDSMVTGLLILALLPASYAYIRGRGEFNDKRETEWLKSYAFPRLAKLLHKHDLDFDDLDEIIRSKVADLPEGYATYATYFAYNPERGQSFS